ncbi:hypothetical protein [Nostoc sp. NMS4]|uniref:hypothetical protein n=1 Tax=Nostoc sp. NMS4 TaxID=2815390 RepID=UPI0025DA14FA|nr:hypothetical protein [Nostoc sp. NMS4]MBN3922054.1 hypothetical protein [Nostoc sp. NMS4]
MTTSSLCSNRFGDRYIWQTPLKSIATDKEVRTLTDDKTYIQRDFQPSPQSPAIHKDILSVSKK